MTDALSTERRPLDVLVLESHPHAADRAARLLAEAGHRVHRCFEVDGPDFPCRAVTDRGTCPMDGPIDVALLSRRPFEPLPTRREEGVTCALRADVPLVAEGSRTLDPFEPWVDVRIPMGDPSLVRACEWAAGKADRRLKVSIIDLIAPAIRAAGMDPVDVGCRLERQGPTLNVHIDLPGQIDLATQQAVGVRVLDAVRSSSTETYGHVDVHVHPTLRTEAS
jgi:hypothetical protein